MPGVIVASNTGTRPIYFEPGEIMKNLTRWPAPQESGLRSASGLGYDANSVISPTAKAAARLHANVTISNGKYYWPMFVHDVNADFALAGSTAQSWSTRDFYPRNFTLPSFKLLGQSLDQDDYGSMCDFVLHEQRRLLSRPPEGLTQLTIASGGSTNAWFDTMGVIYEQGGKTQSFPNQKNRGSHDHFVALGYVASIPRQHQQGVYSPQYQMGFIIAQMISGPWSETIVQANNQLNWIQIVENASNISSTKANISQAKTNLKWAAAHSGNIINTGN